MPDPCSFDLATDVDADVLEVTGDTIVEVSTVVEVLEICSPSSGAIEVIEVPDDIELELDVGADLEVIEAGTQGPPGPQGPSGTTTPPIFFAYGDVASRLVVQVPRPTLALCVNLIVTEAFNGVGATVSVGTAAQAESLVPANKSQLDIATEFESDPNVVLGSGDDIYLYLTPGAGATHGAGYLVIDRIEL